LSTSHYMVRHPRSAGEGQSGRLCQVECRQV